MAEHSVNNSRLGPAELSRLSRCDFSKLGLSKEQSQQTASKEGLSSLAEAESQTEICSYAWKVIGQTNIAIR